MTYGRFASLYDHLMNDMPYDEWFHFVMEKRRQYHITGESILDIACGTGELSVRFARAGLSVTGVDLSEEMLTVAETKAMKEGLHIPFFQQDMAQMDLPGPFDCITIFCDSLNYLESEADVKKTFSHVHQLINEQGIFLFDVHSLHKMREIFSNQTFTFDDEQIAYIWNCFEGEHEDSVEHELTFFVQDEHTRVYHRYDEDHKQRTFPIEIYQQWLVEAGFEVLEVSADFTGEEPKEDSERIFFVAKPRKSLA